MQAPVSQRTLILSMILILTAAAVPMGEMRNLAEDQMGKC